MLIPLHPSPAVPPTPVYMPNWLQPLIDPALDEESLPGVVTKIIARFGFETMVYGTAKTKHRGGDELAHIASPPRTPIVNYKTDDCQQRKGTCEVMHDAADSASAFSVCEHCLRPAQEFSC